MTALEFEFVRVRRRWPLAGVALLTLGIAAAAFSIERYAGLGGEIARLQHKKETVDGRNVHRSKGVDGAPLKARIELANQLIRRKALPWDTLFRDIEAASDRNVGLLSIQPEAESRQVRITGEARNAGALAAYITRLEEQPSLRDVFLVEHELRQDQGQHPLRFGLSATWTDKPS